jgi:hypothetical protein
MVARFPPPGQIAGSPRPEVQLLPAKGHLKRRWLGAIRRTLLGSQYRRGR